ncbi:outer membrane beta-barrel protein [Winogradskyella bathintestinalis]|uniref:Outer membrane beta-barrel protein n=1 Tax=Winogradskyella bathintestinalis TaxID=3035208 RepID=A0ABT7ZSQ6_9FLAO|nr:outer membrane beta-barrel protein [Winogradskyella bathintestinalis]MDN3492033.1 outer membrane beta-barrel protein [Winogradskyella bathintestinalis]
MKRLILIVLLVSFSLSSFAQREAKDWYLNIGVNAINSLGSQSPIYHPDEWAFEFPISAAVEYNWNEQFSIEQSITFNGFNESNKIDGVNLDQDYNYISLDTNVKYYLGEYIFGRNLHWLDFYASAGVGFYHIDETNISANLGGGLLVWLNSAQTFGLKGQLTGKFAFDHPDSGFDNNHYQYHLQAVFKL